MTDALPIVRVAELDVVHYERADGRTSYDFFDDTKKAAYLALIRRGVRRVRAAEYVGVRYQTVRKHFKAYPEFYDAVVEAEMARVDEVEEALFETAIGGNVIAQQVILYNRRPEEWADQRQRAKLGPGDDPDALDPGEAAAQVVSGLRSKLLELHDRLAPKVEDEVAADEPEPVHVVD